MKKLLFLFTFIVFTLVTQVKASDATLFHIDEKSVYNEFEGLTLLEDYVSLNEGTTMSTLLENEEPLLNDLNLADNSNNMLNSLGTSMDFDTASFMLGIGAGIVACGLGCFFAVYVMAYSVTY